MYRFEAEEERIEDLITVLYKEMNRLIKIRDNHKTLPIGVSWAKHAKKYTARYSKHHLGYYDTLEEAIKVREEYVKGL